MPWVLDRIDLNSDSNLQLVEKKSVGTPIEASEVVVRSN